MPTERRPRRNPPGLVADVALLRSAAIEHRWALGLVAVAWVHLGVFLACHVRYRAGLDAPPFYLATWSAEALASFLILRRTLTKAGRVAPPPMAILVAKVWITFLILGFSTVSLNRLMGMPPDWFKPAWATLSTFGFATMAWTISLWFLVPAVQMSLTAALMVLAIDQAYLIYGLSWWLALHLVALALELDRRRSLRDRVGTG